MQWPCEGNMLTRDRIETSHRGEQSQGLPIFFIFRHV